MKFLRSIGFIILGIVIFGSIAIFATTLTNAFVSSAEDREVKISTPHDERLQEVASTLPSRLIVPALNINTSVQKVGISKKGTMAVPTNYADAGWYKYGTIPGHEGSAVIAGHYDNGFGQDAVFKRLSELRRGDDVMVVDESGTTLRFKVTHSGTIDSTTNDTEDIFTSDDGGAQLVLITCEGEWDPETKSYAERRVIYTELIGTEE